MLSTFGQENLTNAHRTAAARKPLNQASTLGKTSGANLKTPFRTQNDENRPLTTAGKGTKQARTPFRPRTDENILQPTKNKNTFMTPAPPRTTTRAPLGAKTANVRATAFQTPAPARSQRPTSVGTKQTGEKHSTTRRSVKKKVYVEPEPVPEQIVKPSEPTMDEVDEQSDFEPDIITIPPQITPLLDVPLDFDAEIDTTYPELRPENFNRGVGQIYFQSPKDDNGVSLSLKRLEERYQKSLEDDLDKILNDFGSGLSDDEDFELKLEDL